MWVALGILVWVVLSFPLGVAVGHVLKVRNKHVPQYCHPSFGCDCDGSCK